VENYLKIIDIINQKVGQLFALLLYPMILFTVYEVFMRYVSSNPTKWVFETTLFLYGASMLIGGGYTLKERGHVGMDVVYLRLSPRVQGILDIITSLAFFAFVSVLLYQSSKMAIHGWIDKIHSSSPWGPPTYPLMTTIPLGAFLLLIQGLAKLIRDINKAITGIDYIEENRHGH